MPTSSPVRRRPRLTSPSTPAPLASAGGRGRSLLIVQCDTDKLVSDRLAMADTLAATATLVLPDDVRVDLVQGTDRSDLYYQLGALGDRTYTTVVVIGHSNAGLIRVASDETMDWPVFPTLLARFRPRSVFLVACKAGSFAAASHLFAGIPSVKEVYGSPVNAGASMVKAMHVLLPLLVLARDGDADGKLWLQGFNFLATDEVLFRFTRKEWERADEGTAFMWEVAQEVTPDLVGALRELKRGG